MNPSPFSSRRAAAPASWAALAALCLAAAAFAFGTKLALIAAYGSGVPFMDEWDGLGRALFAYQVDHTLHASDFLQPHNEHRLVLTRLIGYALATANGQWDPILEMTANAVLQAGFCLALLAFARRFLDGIRFAMAALALTALYSLNYDWENTIEGFQSQFTLLEGCALAMFWLCLTARPLGIRWACGLGFGIAGLGAMASGFVAAAVTLGVMVLGAVFRRRWEWRESVAAILLAAIVVAGLHLFNHVPGHDYLRADSAREWLDGLATILAWPALRWPVALLVLQLPTGLFLVARLRSRRVEGPDAVLLALIVWSWLQIGALAYGRAKFGMLTSSRFSGVLAVLSAANIIALALLWRGRPARAGAAWTALAIGWGCLFVTGLRLEDLHNHLEFLDSYPQFNAAVLRHVRAFVSSGDIAALRATPRNEMPYPDAGKLAAALGNPGIRSLLPVDVRPPLAVRPAAGSSGFVRRPPDGLPPGVDDDVWVAARGPARLVTEPLSTGSIPLLHFEFCGSPDLDSSVMRLESPLGAEAAPHRPLTADHWRSSDVALPDGLPVRLVVEIPPGDHWFALTAPVEIGRGSSAVRWLLRRSLALTILSGAAFGAALAALLMIDLRGDSRIGSPAPAGPA